MNTGLTAAASKDEPDSRKGETVLRHPGERILVLIGIFKLFKAMLLVVVGVGALNLLHRDIADVVAEWAAALRVDPDNYYLHLLMGKLVGTDDRVLTAIGAGSFFYAALLATEGVGLCLRQRWAEYLTIVFTASFLPLEIYALVRHLSARKAILTVVNAAIVWYLVRQVRRERQLSHHPADGPAEPNAH